MPVKEAAAQIISNMRRRHAIVFLPPIYYYIQVIDPSCSEMTLQIQTTDLDQQTMIITYEWLLTAIYASAVILFCK